MSFVKISSDKVAHVLSTVPTIMTGLAKQRDELLEKCASLENKVAQYERKERIDTLAKLAEARNVGSLGATHEDRVQGIEQALSNGRSLDVMEEAIKMANHNGSIGVLEDGFGNVGKEVSAFEQYILNGDF